MDEKNRFNARIAGKEYTIVGPQTKPHMDAVVALVNTQLEQLNEIDPELSIIDRAILMAINAVSEQLLQEDRIMALEAKLDKLKPDQTPYHSKQSSSNSQRDEG